MRRALCPASLKRPYHFLVAHRLVMDVVLGYRKRIACADLKGQHIIDVWAEALDCLDRSHGDSHYHTTRFHLTHRDGCCHHRITRSHTIVHNNDRAALKDRVWAAAPVALRETLRPRPNLDRELLYFAIRQAKSVYERAVYNKRAVGCDGSQGLFFFTGGHNPA